MFFRVDIFPPIQLLAAVSSDPKMNLKFRSPRLTLCVAGFLLLSGLVTGQAEQPQHQSGTTAMTEQPGLISYLQALGLDVDQNTVIYAVIGSVLIALGALGADAVLIAALLFGRPVMHQLAQQMGGTAAGANPMEGMAAVAANAMKNVFGGQDFAAIISKIISTILPLILRTTSQFVTDQANGQPQG